MVTRFELFASSIASIHRSIQKIQRVEMAKYGLKGPHVQCLLAMKRHSEGITAARLCELCDKDKAAVSRTLAELEQAGMINRTAPDGRRYRSRITLTDQGMAAAEAVTERARLAVHQATGGYGDEEREIFINVLALIAGNLRGICRDGLPETDI